ncbi:MAG TPA: xanthine dehydrogenase family protein molybdopterin-binding subunit [Syntrophomonas sp.]|nr:xanthine dehydrogenase family protein molybdopterin-binding subunit [Syntrophomonas sp.]
MTASTVAIGTALPRADGPDKVRGSEKYAADYYPEDMLWAGVKTSDHAHALIKNIDMAAAAEMPGVKAVLTWKDIKGTNRVGVPENDQPVLAEDKVCYKGDPVALVLAESRALIDQAVKRIKVEYQVLPAVFDPKAALLPEAPVLHEKRADKNLLLGGTIERGQGAAGFHDCYAVVEAEFNLPYQEHAYLETEAGAAWIKEGVLEIVASTQTPFRDRLELAHALGLPPEKVRVIAPYLGGGFGGKDGITVQGLLGLAALHSQGRPVKMWTTREESFLSSTKRHPARVHYRLGCDCDGVLQAMSCRLVLDTGAYASLGGPVLALAMEHAGGVYRIPHVQVEGYCVYTNNPVSGAFRGFGAPQVLAGMEQMIDMLAEKMGLDPVEFRLKNAVRRGDEIATGVLMSNSTGIIACLKEVQRHPLWAQRHHWEQQAPTFKRRAVGIAAGMQGTGYGPMVADIANAKLELLPEGRFRIYSGVADMGQGNNATNVQLAGEWLCQPAEAFELLQPDTSRSLPSGSSSASRTTYSFGNALQDACGQMKGRLLTKACNMGLGIYAEDLLLVPGAVRHLPSGKEFPLGLLASVMAEPERVCVGTYQAPVTRHRHFVSPAIQAAGFPHLVFSFACHLARIEINELTGEITVCDYLACTDGGRVLNPQLYEQQIQGGVVQGMGYALWEDFKVAQGDILTKDLSTYIIPTAMDVPDIISLPIETDEMTGPFGMKGIGEIGINLPFPAIANAVARGVGERIKDGPLTAERVLLALADERRR